MHPNVAYCLDGEDRIIFVNAAWTTFAQANDAPELAPPAILGRSLWDFIVDPTTRHIYQRTYARVRAGRGPVMFPIRCDSPTMRRYLEMAIVGRPNARLDIVVRTIRVEARDPVLLLDRWATKSAVTVRMCAWCNRVADAHGEWLEIETALSQLDVLAQDRVPLISHGMCSLCLAEIEAAAAPPPLAPS